MPFRVGDLVESNGQRWVVSQHHSQVRTVILRDLGGAASEIADDNPDYTLVAHLPTEWPFLTAKRRNSPLVSIHVTRRNRLVSITPMLGWVPSDPLHNGGVIYFNPKLNLRSGEVLVAHHLNSEVSRLNVTPSFGTAQRRLAIEEARRDPPAPHTRYDHLLSDEDEDA